MFRILSMQPNHMPDMFIEHAPQIIQLLFGDDDDKIILQTLWRYTDITM